MKIVIVSNNYPSPQLPHKGAFVFNLAQALSKFHHVTVISPLKFHEYFKKKKYYGEEACSVFRPIYFSFGNKRVLGIDFSKISFLNQKNSVLRFLNSRNTSFDLIYTHFFLNALTVDEFAQIHKIPLVVATGESNYDHLLNFGKRRLNEFVKRISKVIAVSYKNKVFVEELGIQKHKIAVIPNAVDFEVFFPMDKELCKESLGYSKNDIIIGFIGHFIKRKGLKRLIKAIDLLGRDDIKLICVGEGDDFEERPYLRHFAPLANKKLTPIINAFDIFVLPTLSEGHCNVIEEVKACCVPVISSKGTTVEQQIDNEIGRLVNPNDINEISRALEELISERNKLDEFYKVLMERRKGNPFEMRINKINKLLYQTLSENG
jgi:teichuronic acid biosynthesis glycosyltransferase TuaC